MSFQQYLIIGMKMNKKFKLSALAACTLVLFGCNSNNSDSVQDQSSSVKDFQILSNKIELKKENKYCKDNGILIEFGEDKNKSNKLDRDEVQDSRYVCDDDGVVKQGDNKVTLKKALVATSNILPNTSECHGNGGRKILLGVDENSNNLLEKNEIKHVYDMCNIQEKAEEVKINSIASQLVQAGSTITIKVNITNLPKYAKVVWYDDKGKMVGENLAFEYTAPKVAGNYNYTIKVEDIGNKKILAKQSVVIKVIPIEVPTKTGIVELKNQSVYIPSEFRQEPLSGDINGAMIYAQNIKPLLEAYSFKVSEVISTPNDNNEMMGFVAEKSAKELGKNINDIQDSLVNSINQITFDNSYITDLTNLSTTKVSDVELSTDYDLTLSLGEKPTDLIEKIINQIALDKDGGQINDLTPSEGETLSSEYKLNMNVKFNQSTDSITMIVTLVSKESEKRYQDIIVKTTSESISVDKAAVIKNKTDTFAAKVLTSKSDFLFVIDNSGSMYDEQQDISTLTESFKNTMQTMGIDFQVATITTDTSELRGKGFTNDFKQITADFKPGTYGNGIERGIYFSEKALKPNGSVIDAGYPRIGASLSVIIMSDEQSQYESCGWWCASEDRAEAPFDVKNNLFVKNGYRVYSIVEPSNASDSQYDDLANETNGKTLNINAQSEYQVFMDKIAKDSGSMSAGYKLKSIASQTVLSSTLKVTVDGIEIPRDSKNGWQYYPQSNSVLFFGRAIPKENSKINISYKYVDGVKKSK